MLRGFAQYQPMTPVIDAMRSILLGETWDLRALVAGLVWCAALTGGFHVAAMVMFKKRLAAI